MASGSSSAIFAKISWTRGSPADARQRRRVRLFLAWCRRANVTGALNVDWDDRVLTRPAIDDEQRFAILRRLPHDPELDPRDRFAGSVLLLYGNRPPGSWRSERPTSEPLQVVRSRCGSVAARSRSRTARSGRAGAARPTAEAGCDRRVAAPRSARRAAHHRRQAAATPEALRDRAQPRGATRRAVRARRATPRADPGGADRDPPVPRGRVGSPGRGDIRRLRRPRDGGLRRLGRVRRGSSHARASRRSLIG